MIGNLGSLEKTPKKTGINVRRELLKFHETYYVSPLMKLAVLGKGTLN